MKFKKAPKDSSGFNPFHDIMLTAFYLVGSYALIKYLEFGIFVVIGLILYSISTLSRLQCQNAEEGSFYVNNLHQRIDELEEKLNTYE